MNIRQNSPLKSFPLTKITCLRVCNICIPYIIYACWHSKSKRLLKGKFTPFYLYYIKTIYLWWWHAWKKRNVVLLSYIYLINHQGEVKNKEAKEKQSRKLTDKAISSTRNIYTCTCTYKTKNRKQWTMRTHQKPRGWSKRVNNSCLFKDTHRIVHFLIRYQSLQGK